MRADLEVSVEQTTAKLRTTRMLELEDLEMRVEAEKKISQEISSVVEKVRAQIQKDREDLEAAQHHIEEAEWALAAAKAKEDKCSCGPSSNCFCLRAVS